MTRLCPVCKSVNIPVDWPRCRYCARLGTLACACGGTVTVPGLDPVPAMREHIRTEPHRAWSDADSLMGPR